MTVLWFNYMLCRLMYTVSTFLNGVWKGLYIFWPHAKIKIPNFHSCCFVCVIYVTTTEEISIRRSSGSVWGLQLWKSYLSTKTHNWFMVIIQSKSYFYNVLPSFVIFDLLQSHIWIYNQCEKWNGVLFRTQ